LTRSVNTQLGYVELLMLLVGCWLRWPGDCSWRRWRRCCLEDYWECCSSLGFAWWGVLFSESRWSQKVSWSGWFPLKPLPTCSNRWLHCRLQNVPREHANCTAGTVRVNWFSSSCWLKRLPRSRSYFTTDSQSVSISWYRAPLWELRPDIISCRNVVVWNLRSYIFGASSLTRGRVCNLQFNHPMVRVAQNP
jgi:hypothetical protein